MGISLFIKFIISLLLGSMIGLERETGNDKKQELWTLGGVRTFALISFLGSISGFLFLNKDYALSNIISIFVFLAILVYYFITAFKANTTGLTTEISALFAYLIGLFIITDIVPMPVVVAFSIILILILSNKKRSKKLASNISKKEWNSFLSFAIILLVILPFLPNINYKLKDLLFLNLPWSYKLQELNIINPYNLWLIIVLISGINLLGYLLRKKLGKNRGLYLCGFLGGIMSSTLTNHLLTEQSKKENTSNQINLVIGNLLAYIASIVHATFFIAILNITLLIKILPGLILIILSVLAYIWFLKQKTPKVCSTKINLSEKESPDLLLVPAVKFALLLTAIKIFAGIAFLLGGSSWFLIASVLSSLTGVDAIVVNISEMTLKTITINYGILVILIINVVNLFGKWIYSYWKGSKTFSFLNFVLLIIVSIVSFLWYLSI